MTREQRILAATNVSTSRTQIAVGKELHLKLEKDTVLRIWKNRDGVYMRIDKYQAYSAPLSLDSAKYLEDINVRAICNDLARMYGFNSGNTELGWIDTLPDIIDYTMKLEVTKQKSW